MTGDEYLARAQAALDRAQRAVEQAEARARHYQRFVAASDATVRVALAGRRHTAADLVAAALTPGPATTAEVDTAVHASDCRLFYGQVYRALRQLEAVGQVDGFRPPAGGCVLWVLREP